MISCGSQEGQKVEETREGSTPDSVSVQRREISAFAARVFVIIIVWRF